MGADLFTIFYSLVALIFILTYVYAIKVKGLKHNQPFLMLAILLNCFYVSILSAATTENQIASWLMLVVAISILALLPTFILQLLNTNKDT